MHSILTCAVAGALAVIAGLSGTLPAVAGTLGIVYQSGARDGANGFNSLYKPLPVAGGAVIVEAVGAAPDEGIILLLSPAGAGERYQRTVLHRFAAACSADGGGPSGRLVADRAGNVWGMTNHSCGVPGGTLFELVQPAAGGKWTYRRVLRMPPSFFQNSGGGYDDLVFDPKGNLYGLLRTGNDCCSCAPTGCGILFEIPSVRLGGGVARVETLYTFPNTAGGVPAGLVRDKHGNFFGTEFDGGTALLGAVWEVSPPAGKGLGWTGMLIHSFCTAPDQYQDCPDGSNPTGAPAVDVSGGLYGTSSQSGAGPAIAAGVIWYLQPPAAEGSWSFFPIHTLYYELAGGDDHVWAPLGDTLLSKTGQVITFVEYGGFIGTFPNEAVAHGGVLGVSPKTGDDILLSNAFGAYGVQSGPNDDYNTGYGLNLDGEGNLYGWTGAYYYKNPKLGETPAVIFEITP